MHDAYSGTSHLLCLPGFRQYQGKTNFGTILHLWIEPVAVFVIATALRTYSTDHRLSTWLPFVALGMWLKEFMNYWYGLRSEKKREDLIEDAEEKMPTGGSLTEVPLPSGGGRKPRMKRGSTSRLE